MDIPVWIGLLAWLWFLSKVATDATIDNLKRKGKWEYGSRQHG